ncbi:MAG: hypothetical protein WCC81_23790 [Pseudolabrys sp.]
MSPIDANRVPQRHWNMPSRIGAILLATIALPGVAFAYRPFDGTDAAVAEPGEVEIEFQPAGMMRSGEQKVLVAPATVFNFGLLKNWEAVLEGQFETPFSPTGPTSLTDAGAFLKYVLRPGVLQGQAGPSIATEFGGLLPNSIGDTGVGARVAGIVSQRWDWGTLSLNVSGEFTRDQHANVFTGIIIEGPFKWTVRPVAEFFYEEEFGQAHTISALVGAIWQVRDNLSFDIGFRHAIVNGANVDEVRAGLTIGFSPLSLRPNKSQLVGWSR